MNRLRLLALSVVLFLLATLASAQQFDGAFGVGSVSSPSGASALTSTDHTPQSLGGGLFLSFSGDYLIRHHFGVGGEIAWRASQGNFFGVQPYRPLFYDFNGVFAPPLGKHAAVELQGGIGAESIRLYQNFLSCSFTSCTNYTSSNHFLGHFGGGIRFFPFGHFFVRPEAHLYLVRNNFEFSSNRAVRYGVSLGYTFGGGETP